MRWLIGIFAVFLVLWCGWWFAGRHVILSQTEQLIGDQRAAGATLDLPGFDLAGFPSRFDLSTDSISWRSPDGSLSYKGGAAYVYAMSWKPWHLVFWLPDSQVVTFGDQSLKIDGTSLHASLRAVPSLDVPLALAAFSARDLSLTPGAGLSLGIGETAVRVEAAELNSYHVGATLTAIRPDAAILAALASVEVPQMPTVALPDQIDRFHLNAFVTLTAPLDRHAGETKPRVISVDLSDLSLAWGDLQISTAGSVSPDADGFAAGTVTLTIRGWEQLPRLLVALGVIPPNMSGFLASMLRGIASGGTDPDSVKMDLVLKDGLMNFGPLPLGAAPRLNPPVMPQG